MGRRKRDFSIEDIHVTNNHDHEITFESTDDKIRNILRKSGMSHFTDESFLSVNESFLKEF